MRYIQMKPNFMKGTLPETIFLHLKTDGCKTIVSFWKGTTWQVRTVKHQGGYRILKLKSYWSDEKRAPGWAWYTGDEILPNYMGIIS